MTDITQPRSGLWKSAALCAGLIAVAVLLDLPTLAEGQELRREDGGLETVTVVLYVGAVLVVFAAVPRCDWRPLFRVPALLLFFAMRELDFDKAFTSSGVLLARFYTGDSPLPTKLMAGSVALFLPSVIYRISRFGIPAAWQALRAGQQWPWFAGVAAALTVGTKGIDDLARKFAVVGVEISPRVDSLASTIEETGEALTPVCAKLAILPRWQGCRS